LVISLAGEEMDLSRSFPGVAATVVQFQDQCYLSVRNKLMFTAADVGIFMEPMGLLMSVIHWK